MHVVYSSSDVSVNALHLYTGVACIHLCGLLQSSLDVGMTEEQQEDEENQFLSSTTSQDLSLFFYFQLTDLCQPPSEEGHSWFSFSFLLEWQST